MKSKSLIIFIYYEYVILMQMTGAINKCSRILCDHLEESMKTDNGMIEAKRYIVILEYLKMQKETWYYK